MKIGSYILSIVCGGVLLSCSEDSNIPEIPVFKPDATLSFATSVDGVKSTLKDATYDDSEDASIHKLQMIVFTGQGENAVYQTDTMVIYQQPETAPAIVGKRVQSGAASVLVLANAAKVEGLQVGVTKLSDVLSNQKVSLEQENSTNGYTMSSEVYNFNLVAGKRNTVGDFGYSTEVANKLPVSAIELIRLVSKVNLVKLTFSTEALEDGSTPISFTADSIFAANVKSVSMLAVKDKWGQVETEMTGNAKWWFGAFPTGRVADDIYSQVVGDPKDLLLVDVKNGQDEALKAGLALTSSNTTYPTSSDVKVIGKSFLVYENMMRDSKNEVPLNEQTLLIVSGTYTRQLPNGTLVSEAGRYYTVPVNNKDFGAQKPTNVAEHWYVKRNVKYNISLTIKSSGSSTPYGKDAYAHVSAQVEVAPWKVVNQSGEVD